jgi:hypothetical protein
MKKLLILLALLLSSWGARHDLGAGRRLRCR